MYMYTLTEYTCSKAKVIYFEDKNRSLRKTVKRNKLVFTSETDNK